MTTTTISSHSFCLLFAICVTLGAGAVAGDSSSIENTDAKTNATAVVRPSLTLEQAVHNALANNRELAAARVRVEEAQARLVQAGLWPNPELELDGRFDNAFSNEGEYTYAAAINQPFSVSGRIGAQKNVAQVYIERTRAEIRDLECRTAAAVRTEFAEVLAATEQAKLQAVLVGLDEGLLEATRMARARGQASEQALDSILIARQQAGAAAFGTLRGNRNIGTPLTFVRIEPLVVPKQSLTGDSAERVDTRVLQVIFSFERGNLPIYVGQQMDVFIDTPQSTQDGVVTHAEN